MNHLDDMFKIAMAIDADNIADITSGKASFAEYPDEKPSKVKLIAWLDSWHDDLVGLGYGASLRGEAPYQLAKLRPRPLIDIPGDAEASKKLALETENARITHSNDVNKVEYDGKMLDINNVIACKLAKALRPRAPLLLKKLQTAHLALRADGLRSLDVKKWANPPNSETRVPALSSSARCRRASADGSDDGPPGDPSSAGLSTPCRRR